MKFKKRNLLAAMTVMLVGALSLGLWSHPAPDEVTNIPSAAGSAPGLNADGSDAQHGPISERDFLPDGKQVTPISWGGSFCAMEMPWQPTLCKWKSGGRVFYQMEGPINRACLARSLSDPWGNVPVYEIFFRRDGGRYDQWLITPSQAVIYHQDGILDGTYDPPELGAEDLPSDRYRLQIRGETVTLTFSCEERDTPGNIVFNYNLPGPSTTSYRVVWTDTKVHPSPTEEVPQSHHDAAFWTHP